MQQFKTWIIGKDDFGEDDILWLRGFGITIVPPDVTVETVSLYGHQFQVAGKKTPFGAITTTQKQEQMLSLKYGNCMLLSQVMVADDETWRYM